MINNYRNEEASKDLETILINLNDNNLNVIEMRHDEKKDFYDVRFTFKDKKTLKKISKTLKNEIILNDFYITLIDEGVEVNIWANDTNLESFEGLYWNLMMINEDREDERAANKYR